MPECGWNYQCTYSGPWEAIVAWAVGLLAGAAILWWLRGVELPSFLHRKYYFRDDRNNVMMNHSPEKESKDDDHEQ